MSQKWSASGRADAPRRDRQGYTQLNPAWRGVGCLLLIAIPIASWFVADWLRLLNFREGWVPYLWDVPWYMQNAALAFIMTFLMYALLTVLYGWIRRPQYGDPLTIRGPSRRKPRRSR